MIPLLIISDEPKLIQDYIEKIKGDSQFYKVLPSTKEYSIDDIKNIFRETKIFYQKTRIYYFPNFHLSSIPAQNSFLKLLEEPPNNVQFVLSCVNLQSLLATIVSRTKIIRLQKNKKISLNKSIQQQLEAFISNQKLNILNSPDFSQIKRDTADEIFDQIIFFFKSKLDSDKKSPAVIKEILRLKNLMESNNLNPQLSVDQTLIFISKQYKMKLL